jgi:hypothetical protein
MARFRVTYLQELVQPFTASKIEDVAEHAKKYAANNFLLVSKIERIDEPAPAELTGPGTPA